ncbi:hypothetical protein NP493_182g00020 [Ridgeia piscesae]|uniref:Uncharacterized protein n=1 Tax=Ridgeia piscesae TaxID=27915 RepID=A0AAD9P2F9_RIDPI|nr:hypothetical protein NP493_182g00020 [Ridgeia piscesae]
MIGRYLPSLEILYQQRLLGRATLISQDSSHPAHHLFDPLQSSRRFRSIKTRTSRFSTSFFPLSRSSPVKTEVIFSHPQQTHIPLSDEFLVCIFYYTLLYNILFHILHFKLIYLH